MNINNIVIAAAVRYMRVHSYTIKSLLNIYYLWVIAFRNINIWPFLTFRNWVRILNRLSELRWSNIYGHILNLVAFIVCLEFLVVPVHMWACFLFRCQISYDIIILKLLGFDSLDFLLIYIFCNFDHRTSITFWIYGICVIRIS
mgnify:CR=1 FL=1